MNNRSASSIVLQAENLEKQYTIGRKPIHALRGVDLCIHAGEFVAIIGPSGAGKSTLLHLLGTLEQPSSGVLEIRGQNVSELTEKQLAALRGKHIGFVFQFHHLLPAFTALENTTMPSLIQGISMQDATTRAESLLESLGLSDRLNNKPSELSGGEQQRVAVARSLMNKPSLLLADEPSGNLDRVTGKKLEDDLVRFARQGEAAVIVVTHNEEWAMRADRVINLVDGRIQD